MIFAFICHGLVLTELFLIENQQWKRRVNYWHNRACVCEGFNLQSDAHNDAEQGKCSVAGCVVTN